ncbi:hypothetical protein SCUP234_09251 [Seiridium cupressi]
MYSSLKDSPKDHREKPSLDESEQDTLLEGGELCHCQKQRSWLSVQLRSPFAWVNLALLAVNTYFIIRGARATPHYVSSVVHSIQSHVTSPSPAEEAIEYQLQRFTELDDHYGPLTSDPGPEVDGAWDQLVDATKVFAVDEDAFVMVNGNTETGVRIPGTNQFIAILEVNHQLHCVEIMRRGIFFNYDYYKDKQYFGGRTLANVKWHIRHCFEVLRQSIQCHGDTSVLTYNWVRNNTNPEIASKTLHSCQNWDRLKEWRQTHDATKRVTHLERPLWVTHPDLPYPGPPGAAEPQISWKTEQEFLATHEQLSTKDGGPAAFLFPRDLEIKDAES